MSKKQSDKCLFEIAKQYKDKAIYLLVMKCIKNDFNLVKSENGKINSVGGTYYFTIEIVGEESQSKIENVYSNRELNKLLKRIKNILKVKELNVQYIDIEKTFYKENIMEDVTNPNIKGFEWGKNMNKLVDKVKNGGVIELMTV